MNIKKYNLTSDTNKFISNKIINELITKEGEKVFPITLIDGVVEKKKAYPTNEDFTKWTGITFEKEKSSKIDSGCCSDSDICSIECAPKNNKPNRGCDGGGCC